ncbi:MAG TPA: GNAT family N-acetyltransferase [Anaerolineales bacterium]|nr:GNAT family N-acetyltransferase [Anaerolineales bacterium]
MPEQSTIGPKSKVSLREITAETVRQICSLSDTLSAAQNKMVAPNAISIAQAHFNKFAWFRAVYADEEPVGFIMLYDNPEEAEYFLWRFMIAAPYQRMGFGSRAMELLFEYIKTRPNARQLGVSCGEGEASPEEFYKKLGFMRTGEKEGDEVVLRIELAGP